MRNQYFLKLPTSNVTHLPIDDGNGGWRPACGLKWDAGNPWEGGYYETFPEITCKRCRKYIPKDARFNRYVTPYKHARAGDDVVTFSSNLEDGSTPSAAEIIKDNSDCQYTWLPSKDGEPSGLLAEWHAGLEMWTVWTFNARSPHLLRYYTGYDYDREWMSWGVIDRETGKFVGHTQTEAGARIMARKRNQQV